MSLCRPDSTGFADNPLHGRVGAIKKLGDMLERLTLSPALPHQRFLLLAVVNPALVQIGMTRSVRVVETNELMADDEQAED
jgi:hypothetical protein